MAEILLIDDDDAFRGVVATTLRQAGHQVTEASDGRKGIAQFRSKPADLVITDLVMPRQEGIETILELRRDFPGLRIIAISGAAHSPTYLRLADQLGATRTLAKPVPAETLLRAVEELLTGDR